MELFNEKPRMIELPRIYDPRGSLSFVQNDGNTLPFDIARAYWIYDVPGGEQRGSHAHYLNHTFIVANSGSFRVNIFDGNSWQSFTLYRPFEGLLVPAGYWHTLDNFSSGAVCMVLTSELYSEEDYIRDFDQYLQYIANRCAN